MLRILVLLLVAVPFHAFAESAVQQAVFGTRQLFWPGLAGVGKTASAGPRGDKTPRLGIAILPIRIRDYSESVQCDSCHRLSANGMEFFLENYLDDRMQARFPKLPVELIAPHFALLQSANIDLPSYQDSLQFPFDAWFDGYEQDLIYRPRDRMTPPGTRRRLDRLGGVLGMSHLLAPSGVRVRVTPHGSSTHAGGLEWSFFLVLWNVAEGRPEWALRFSEKVSETDLDRALDPDLDEALKAAWDKLPENLAALWKAEPH